MPNFLKATAVEGLSRYTSNI